MATKNCVVMMMITTMMIVMARLLHANQLGITWYYCGVDSYDSCTTQARSKPTKLYLVPLGTPMLDVALKNVHLRVRRGISHMLSIIGCIQRKIIPTRTNPAQTREQTPNCPLNLLVSILLCVCVYSEGFPNANAHTEAGRMGVRLLPSGYIPYTS